MPSKIPTIASPPIRDKCLALINIAKRDAAEAVIEYFIHRDNTAVIPKELKNEKANKILIPRNSFLKISIYIPIAKQNIAKPICEILIIVCGFILSDR